MQLSQGVLWSGVVSPDVVTLNVSGTFPSKNVGTGLTVTSTSTLGGANAGNYTLTQPTGITANITALSVTVTGLTANDKTYDGTTTATFTGGTVSGVLGGDVVTLVASGTFPSKNIGTGLTVTSTSTLGGADGGNYIISPQPTGLTANINAKALTITGLAAANKQYDGTATATFTGGTLVGVVSPDVVTFSTSGTFPSPAIGTGLAVTSTTTLGGAGAGNYILTQPTGLTANITQKTLTVTGLTASNKPYDQTNTATLTGGTLVGVVSPDVVTLIPSGTFPSKNVGTGLTVTSTSTLGGANASNYTLSQPTGLTANITALSVTVTGLTANNKTYDGTTTATFTGGTVSGVLGGDVVTLVASGTFPSKNIGTGLTVTSTSTLGGADGGNYIISPQPTGLTANINAKALTITGLAAANKQYDGTATATFTGGTLVGIISPDVVTFTASGTFASANLGTGLAVTSTTTLGGAGAGNYTLTQPTGLTANITAKTLTMTGLTANNKVYDGTTAATFTTPTLVGVVSPDVVTVSTTGTFASKNVGTNIAVSSTSVLGGASAGNYTVTQITGLKANITQKALTITGLTANNKVYDGTTAATFSGGSLVGVISPDVVTFTTAGAFASSNAANGIAVSSTCTLGGAGAGNYSINPQPSGLIL